MIILDTMVVLEPYRRDADARVLRWLDGQATEDLWLTSITAAELQTGVERQRDAHRRQAMQIEVTAILEAEFANRILPFDRNAAVFYGEIAGRRQRADRKIYAFDYLIAAIARLHGARVATRNVSDFEGCGVELIDPWAA